MPTHLERMSSLDAIVVGGGLYGAQLAVVLAAGDWPCRRVLLVEREPRLLARASTLNQARIHQGYHYPRSILTSLRSRVNYDRFVRDYAECVDEGFAHYYAIARGSKVSAGQFAQFCRRIGAPLEEAPGRIASLFAPDRVTAVFRVREGVFNAHTLREALEQRLARAGVEVACGTDVSVVQSRGEVLAAYDSAGREVGVAPIVVNCTYAGLNGLLSRSQAETIAVRLELAELALVDPPAALEGAAVTVMDGPFFSLMPYPPTNQFTLSHVRYTPHATWAEGGSAPSAVQPAMTPSRPASSRATHMVRDAARYLPSLRHTRYVGSLWEDKVLMPRSDADDSRPILFRESTVLPGLVSVLGSKIDNVYDVEDALRSWLARVRTAATVRSR